MNLLRIKKGFRVQRASVGDVAVVAPLFDEYRRFYRQRSNRAAARRFLRQRLARGESVVFVAWAGSAAVGFVQLYPTFDSVRMRSMYVLYDLWVVPAARRQGVARRLMERACAHARATGAAGLVLETAIDNQPAQRLYAELGWKRDEHFYRYSVSV